MTAGLSFVILYGSQLGQAKSLAEGIAETCADYGLTTQAFSLNEIKEIKEIQKTNIPIVIITSTTGDGEAPENADKFFRKLRRRNLEANTLQSVRYSILGLGDTNYNDFCNCGKTIHKRFQDLGATLFHPTAWADDAVGQDQIIEDWIDGLWPAISAEIGLTNNSPTSTDQINGNMTTNLTLPACPQPYIDLTFPGDQGEPVVNLLTPPAPYPSIDGEPFVAKLTNTRVLTKEGAVKTTLEVTLSLEGKEFDFEPGDAIGIVCPNPTSEVQSLLERLKLTSKQHEIVELNLKSGTKSKFPIFLPKRSTLHDLFTHFLDIRTAPKKIFLRLLAEATEAENEKSLLLELCSREGSTKYEESIRFPSLSILDILLKYPSCHPSVESLLEHLPRLIPRAYSIASSPLASKTSFTLAFNIIQIPAENGRMYSRLGLCTGWFHNLWKRSPCTNDPLALEDSLQNLTLTDTFGNGSGEGSGTTSEIVFYKRKNHFFRLPSDVTKPLIMVGPGTGVAPFIGFLEHRHSQKQNGTKVGPMTLYFGCRHRDRDFLYRETLETRQSEESVLTELNISFSRDPDQGGIKYVQDLMEKNGESIVSVLLDQDGFLYVCGDAKNMAKSIREKLISIVQNVKGLTEKEAGDEISGLMSSKRYLQDIWT